MLVAVGAKLQVDHAWYKDINRLRPAYVLHVNTEFDSPTAILSSFTIRTGRRVHFTDYLWVQRSWWGVGQHRFAHPASQDILTPEYRNLLINNDAVVASASENGKVNTV